MTVDPGNLGFFLSGDGTPAGSLGGARTSTPVGAGLHNLFDLVDASESAAGLIDYRCVYFASADPDPEGLVATKVWVETPTTSLTTEIDIGIDPAGKNGDATSIADPLTPPAGVAFSRPSTEETGLALPSGPYVDGDDVAIWIRRTVAPGTASLLADAGVIRVQGDTF